MLYLYICLYLFFLSLLLNDVVGDSPIVLSQPRFVAPVTDGDRLFRMLVVVHDSGDCGPSVLATVGATDGTGDRCVQSAFFHALSACEAMTVVLVGVKRGGITTGGTKQVQRTMELQQTPGHVDLDYLRLRTTFVQSNLFVGFPHLFHVAFLTFTEFNSFHKGRHRNSFTFFWCRTYRNVHRSNISMFRRQ